MERDGWREDIIREIERGGGREQERKYKGR